MVGELFTGFLDNNEIDEKTGNKKPFDLSFLIATLEGMQSYLHDAPSFKSPWSSLFADAGYDPELAGYFWEADKRFLLAFVMPNSTESGFLGTRGALVELRKLIQDTENADFPAYRRESSALRRSGSMKSAPFLRSGLGHGWWPAALILMMVPDLPAASIFNPSL